LVNKDDRLMVILAQFGGMVVRADAPLRSSPKEARDFGPAPFLFSSRIATIARADNASPAPPREAPLTLLIAILSMLLSRR
jgi:hypothetical protein